jgi:hypothetical protein
MVFARASFGALGAQNYSGWIPNGCKYVSVDEAGKPGFASRDRRKMATILVNMEVIEFRMAGCYKNGVAPLKVINTANEGGHTCECLI